MTTTQRRGNFIWIPYMTKESSAGKWVHIDHILWFASSGSQEPPSHVKMADGTLCKSGLTEEEIIGLINV